MGGLPSVFIRLKYLKEEFEIEINKNYMQKLLKNWIKHIVAMLILLVTTVIYFSPSVIDGKVLQQGDNIKATGMGGSQMKQYEETAEPGEFSAWSDAMFGGMPYVATYGNPAPNLPRYSLVDKLFIAIISHRFPPFLSNGQQ